MEEDEVGQLVISVFVCTSPDGRGKHARVHTIVCAKHQAHDRFAEFKTLNDKKANLHWHSEFTYRTSVY
jgi:hypothetical protein